MQVFQVHNDICHWKAPYESISAIPAQTYAPDIQFVEAPNEVREGWGYIGGEFVKPTPPEGWLYDDETGTFYPEGETAPSQYPAAADLLALQDQRILELEYQLLLLQEGLA